LCLLLNGVNTLCEDSANFGKSIFECLECCGETVLESTELFSANKYVLNTTIKSEALEEEITE
jgi:hypothetical protein